MPPRLPDQPIFYPVLNEDYAIRIARDWNVKASGVGKVTCFDVERTTPTIATSSAPILEYWISAGYVDEFNRHIIGLIEVAREFR